jgi:hypothetical protein
MNVYNIEIIERVLRKYGMRMWTRFSWLGCGGGIFRTRE